MLSLTIIIPVKNEQKNLPSCLEKLAGFAERIIVVDSFSTDKTPDIVRASKAEYVNFDWNGLYPKKRNWILRHHTITTEWVLFLDADEYITDEFIDEVRATLPDTSHDGFWLNYESYFMGKKLKGGDPFRKLALFRMGSGEYEETDEDHWSHLDMEVHEHPVLKGTTGEIKAKIDHRDNRGLDQYLRKHNEYSTWEAYRHRSLQQTAPHAWATLTPRQQRKYRNLHKWWMSPAYFFFIFVWKKGFMNGWVGFHFALLKAIYFYQIRLKIKELKREGDLGTLSQ